MRSGKKPPERDASVPAGDRCATVLAAVAGALRAELPRGGLAAVALSGGRDSVVLLDAMVACAPAVGLKLAAVHVHHGLSPQADRWAAFCATVCAERGVPLDLRNVVIERRAPSGVEAEARRLRHAALADAARTLGAAAVALAHHQDDQAETLLLQLGRGAGPHGLAGMPSAHRDASGLLWLRPLLDVPRATLAGHAAARGLAWVEDPSNADRGFRRNAVRLDLAPALAATFPGYPATLARAARHQAEAAALLDDLAAADAAPFLRDDGLATAALTALAPARARNLLRWFLRARGLRAPTAAQLAAMVAQLRFVRADARVGIAHDGRTLGVHRGVLHVHGTGPPPFRVEWLGQPLLELPHGHLAFVPVIGEGLSVARLAAGTVVVRSRVGGERFRPQPARPRRALKAWLQESGLPTWERAGLPLVFCDDRLAAVPGLGTDPDYRADPGAPGLRLDWAPRPAIARALGR